MFMDFTPNNACKEIYHKIYARFITRFKAIGRLKIKLPRYLREIYHKIFARFKSNINRGLNPFNGVIRG